MQEMPAARDAPADMRTWEHLHRLQAGVLQVHRRLPRRLEASLRQMQLDQVRSFTATESRSCTGSGMPRIWTSGGTATSAASSASPRILCGYRIWD